MRDHRRIARELALRVLYEVDVGKQPAREALRGAMDQIAGGVRAGITMAVREAERAMVHRENGPAVFTPRSIINERRRVGRAVTRAVQRIADDYEPALHALFVGPDPTKDGDAPARALRALEEAARMPLTRLRRTLDSSSLDAAELDHAWLVARSAVDRMRSVLGKRLVTSLEAARRTSELVRGALRHREEIDERLSALFGDWPIERQSASDRNVMRLAAYELLYDQHTPIPVVLNEAVELAKRYGSEESGRFVNGVLSALVAGCRAAETSPDAVSGTADEVEAR